MLPRLPRVGTDTLVRKFPIYLLVAQLSEVIPTGGLEGVESPMGIALPNNAAMRGFMAGMQAVAMAELSSMVDHLPLWLIFHVTSLPIEVTLVRVGIRRIEQMQVLRRGALY